MKIDHAFNLLRAKAKRHFAAMSVCIQNVDATLEGTKRYVDEIKAWVPRNGEMEGEIARSWSGASALFRLFDKQTSNECYEVALFWYDCEKGYVKETLEQAFEAALEGKFKSNEA